MKFFKTGNGKCFCHFPFFNVIVMESVLIIEDESDLLEEIVDTLRFEGFKVFKAQTGEEGLRVAREKKPDIILCDIVLPGMNGFDILNELKNDDNYHLVPFIFITAKTERVNLRLGMDLGADDYIIKPFARQELINSVNARLKKVKAVRNTVNVLKEQVVASLPHEFRTPLNAILGFSKIIHEDIENYSSTEVSEMAGHVFKSGIDLFRLSQKYLTYIDIISHEQQFYFDIVNNIKDFINDVAWEVATEHDRVADLKTCLINCPLSLIENHFRFALREIIENAFKFSRKGTKVGIEMLEQDGKCQIIINDKGVGFPDGAVSRINAFQQFSAGNFSRKGVGLGLFLAGKIIEKNRGVMNIYSVQGEGTKVILVVPSARDAVVPNS